MSSAKSTSPPAPQARPAAPDGLDLARIGDVEVTFTMRLGRSTLTLQEVMQIGDQSLIELDRGADDPIEVLVNGRLFARGEVVTVGEFFGVRVTEIVGPAAQGG